MATAHDLVLSIDAMGGDFAPQSIVEGVGLARIRHPYVSFLLHGDENRIRPLFRGKKVFDSKVEIHHAANVVGMDDKPSQALRRGRDTSMWRAIESVRRGLARAAVSAGNTGALMAMAKFQLKPIPGISRPAIAAMWPTMRGQTAVLDVGANIGADARQLVDFAVMGGAFARVVLGLDRPTLGLLNIGVEEIKGNEAVKAAAQLLKDATQLPIQFQGYVEGDDIGAGTVDVVVTDGFTGNIALKTAEGTAKLVAHYLRSALRRTFITRVGALLAMGAFKILRAKMDPRAVNGGVFLGLNGIVVKSHGGTDGFGFASAIELAIDMARSDLPHRIAHDLAAVGHTPPPEAIPEPPAAIDAAAS